MRFSLTVKWALAGLVIYLFGVALLFSTHDFNGAWGWGMYFVTAAFFPAWLVGGFIPGIAAVDSQFIRFTVEGVLSVLQFALFGKILEKRPVRLTTLFGIAGLYVYASGIILGESDGWTSFLIEYVFPVPLWIVRTAWWTMTGTGAATIPVPGELVVTGALGILQFMLVGKVIEIIRQGWRERHTTDTPDWMLS